MAVLKGNCYLCGRESGKTIAKTAIKNHILKEHSEDSGQECRLLKIEGAYNKNYWLYVDIPVTSNLSTLDNFLRKIWLECCGHLSAFGMNHREIGMTNKIGNFDTGDVLLHEYDFGSTTDTLITVIGTVYRKQQRGVRLLARNVPMTFACRKCGAPAEFVDPADVPTEFENVKKMFLDYASKTKVPFYGVDGIDGITYPHLPISYCIISNRC